MRVRKNGLRSTVLGIGMLALSAVACSSGSGGTVPDGVDGACSGADAIVTSTNDHVHDVDISDWDAVREREKTYTTTLDDGHTHQVTVTSMEFAQINRGNVVFKVTTRSEGHTHPVAIGCTY